MVIQGTSMSTAVRILRLSKCFLLRSG